MSYFVGMVTPNGGFPFKAHFDLDQPLMNFAETASGLESVEILAVVYCDKPDAAFAHDPDRNPGWKPKIASRVYACGRCGTEREERTNHTGAVWDLRCAGDCRDIRNPHTAQEKVFAYSGPHRYLREA